MLDFDLRDFCYGCGACVNACPRTAIRLVQAEDDSYIPEIDGGKCIRCGKCDRVCIYLNSSKYHTQIAQEGCYAAYQLDTGKREKSASGGMFLPLAMEVLKRGGYVCGCVWSEDMTAVHIVSNQLADVERMCNSKYVQSDIGHCFTEIQGLLKAGKPVLFCGTPCQCTACEAVAGNPDNLIKVSLICEGTPTPKVWQKYREAKEKAYGSKITEVNFRCKEPIGWSLPYYTVKTDVGISYHENSFVLGLLQGLTYRNSCYHCAYKGNNGCADIVIGDLWKAEDRLLIKSILNNAIEANKYVYNPVKRQEVRKTLGLSGKFVVGTVGRLSFQKNPQFNVEIFDEIHAHRPESVLIFVGQGELEDEVRRMVKEKGMEQNVMFLGLRTDVPDLLQAMDVFVLPSRFEGLGIVYIEAQAAGLKTFATAEVVPQEACMSEKLFTYLPRTATAQQWAEAILATDTEHRENTLELIRAKDYDIDQEIDKLRSLYLENGRGQCR